ncbi:MAG TPA: MASE1 domain-containing protein [Polyangiales bacterium]|nr:MASE1 domain-containing protein [Polyangiales bacterium]
MHADADVSPTARQQVLSSARAHPLLLNACVAVLYFGSAKLGLLLASTTKQVTPVWPPTGIAIVALLVFGPRSALGVFAGAFCVNLSMDEPWYTALGIATGNTLGPFAGALFLSRVSHLDVTLARVRDVLALVTFGSIGSMTITATNGVASLAASGIVDWHDYFSVWWVWWVGDAMGVLVVAPFLLTWAAKPALEWRGPRLLEWLALFGSLALTSRFLFWSPMPLTYAVFPFAVWAALRFGPRETASAMLMIATGAVWGLIHEKGPFSHGPEDRQLVFLVLFLGVMAITALVLSAATAERERAEAALKHAHAALEGRVQERTAELASTNGALKRINSELGRRSQELAAKNEEIESFVYVVSHDLRAPLVNLRGFSEELRTSCGMLEQKLSDSDLPEPLAKDVSRIIHEDIDGSLHYVTASSSKLQRLIDSLLTLSRTGRDDYELERLPVPNLVRSTLDVLRGSIEQSGARIEIGELPDAHGDLTAIGQVFTNLISNAVKYLQPGRPGLIEIAGEEQDELCHFWVRDNGAGLHPNALRRIFQVFQRFHPDLASGEGMGLAIVKRVVERHGGQVWVDSEAGIGTTFHVTLPNARGRRTGSWRKIA